MSEVGIMSPVPVGSLATPTPPGSGKRITMSPQKTPASSRPGTSKTGASLGLGVPESNTEIYSPVPDYLKPLVRNAVKRWKKFHEQKVMAKVVDLRNNKKEYTKNLKSKAKHMAKKIPMELLARDWLNHSKATVETRAFLVDKVMPLVVLGTEKLLQEVESRGLANKEEPDANFNPLNFLAKYLMRNNPRYSNFMEASPYMRGMREVAEELKAELFDYEDNRLAKLKADAKRKREEREQAQRMKVVEKERRDENLRNQFLEWNVGYEGMVEVALLQSALRSFAEVAEQYPDELKEAAQFSHTLEPTDETGRMLSLKEFCQYLNKFIEEMPSDVFDQFIVHLSRCALAYRASNERDSRKAVLTNLFMSCDHSGIGLLDRHRILSLFEQFYDKASDIMKFSLRNPRRWPVVELDEEDSAYSDDEDEQDIDIEELKRLQEAEEQALTERKGSASSVKSAGSAKSVKSEKGEEPDTEEPEKQSEDTAQKTDVAESQEVLDEEKSDEPKDVKTEETQEEESSSKAEEEKEGTIAAQEEAEAKPDEAEVQGEEAEAKPEESEAVVDGITDAEQEPGAADAEKSDEQKPADAVDAEVKEVAAVDLSEKEKAAEEKEEKDVDEVGEIAKLDEEIKKAENQDDIEGEGVPPKTTQTGRGSVSFATGTVYEREKTQHSTLSLSRSQSQASAFDENSLNVSQFVQLTETFLGDYPTSQSFERLTGFIRDRYAETDEERMKRMTKARKEALSAKRKLTADALFEKWDNDGSGFLDDEEIEPVIEKYKGGMETAALRKAKKKMETHYNHTDNKFSKKEFRLFLYAIAENVPGDESFEFLCEYLSLSIDRTYAERIRGEARKKWLQQIVGSAETSGANMEAVYRQVFQAFYKDSETHGDGKKISVNIAMIEQNDVAPDRGRLMLKYVAATPEDAPFMIGTVMFKDMRGISFAAIESGKPIHVPRVNNHGNIMFWNPNRPEEEREGSLIVIPLKDRQKRVFGVMSIDTLNDPHTKAIFITHEIQFFQGIAKAFSIAYHHVDIRRKTLRIVESAVSWMHRRCPNIHDIVFYMVEPDNKASDYVLRKMLQTDEKGHPKIAATPPRLERKDNLFRPPLGRDYLFKCVDNSESVTADAYGERHLAIPLRDNNGVAVAVVDISIGALKKLPKIENKEMMKMFKLLQMAYAEVCKESEDSGALDSKNVEVMFDHLMLMDLRENVSKLDGRAYAELRSYKEPPKIIHDIIQAVLSIFYPEKAQEGVFGEWGGCKQFVDTSLSNAIMKYDPTITETLIPAEVIAEHLNDVPHGAVAKHGSIPAQYLYNWVFVCLSLIEHTGKMRKNKVLPPVQSSTPPPPTDAEAKPEEDTAEKQQQEQTEVAEPAETIADSATAGDEQEIE
ncbi:EF-hand calcium-binding domain-containing protein 5-like isoform X2 [Lineus longissimus]|uniref:EF-hand calcium-binding domain-containing protein 5-like isoform X2 n=1 Tax=Lineus longissimus TaxID=88925 RepID=UPI00315CFA5E